MQSTEAVGYKTSFYSYQLTQLCSTLGILLWSPKSTPLEYILHSPTQHMVSHFSIRLQPTVRENFAAGQVRKKFALRDTKLTVFTDIWVHGKRTTSSEVISEWTSAGLGLHSDNLQKGEMSGFNRKMHRTEESGGERKCRRVWDGVPTAGKKAASLPSDGSVFWPPLWPFPAAIMKANKTKGGWW